MQANDVYEFARDVSVIFDPCRHTPDLRYSREPVLRRMGDDSLVCLHYTGGPREPHNENIVVITRSFDDGATWSPGEVLFRHPCRGAWATEIFMGGPRPMAFVGLLNAECHYLELRTSISYSDDHGRSWTEPAAVPGLPAGFSVRRGRVLSDGTWLLPIYWQEQCAAWNWRSNGAGDHHSDPAWQFRCGVLRSTDRGQAFSLHGFIRREGHLWEPDVVELAPGRLMMLMRAEGDNRLYRSDSADAGLTWSPAVRTDIPSANAKLTMFQIDGATVLFHNPAETTGWLRRRTLEAWITRDGGRTWPIRKVLARVRPDVEDRVITYPDGFLDESRRTLYLALDGVGQHYLMKVPVVELLA